VQIKNGSVALSMWKIEKSGQWSRYSGNDTISNGKLYISSAQTLNWDNYDCITLASFTFSNGNANISVD
jgi:hypothetical protein